MKNNFRIQFLLLNLFLLSSSAFAQNKNWLVKMQDPNVNFWELQKEFNDYWKDRTDYKGNGYKVFKRWEYINETRILPNGKLQPAGYVQKEYTRYMAETGAKESPSGTWNIVGPTIYPSNNTGQPTGKGRINAIAFHPSDVNTLFIGAPSGGIWKSTNGGTNWSSLSANIPYLGVSAILIHPANPNIIYIGTGDRDSEDAPGVGVFKSTDGGATWAPANSGMGNTTVGMMLMHPSDPNTLFAATYDGIFKSVNAGASWTLTEAGDFRDIKFKPGDPSILYATRMISPSRFYRSTNTGDSWTQITTPTSNVGARMVIGVSPANANYVYLVQINDNDETFFALLRSADSGQTFSQQSGSPNIFDYACDGSGTASQAMYDLVIDVDQTNAEIIYVGSINSWKSSNGGVNWSPVTHWVGSAFAPGDPTANCAASVHADHHWYQWSPLHSPARLYLGHDGGIAYTADGGTTWTDISTDLPIGQVYKIGQSAHNANTVIAGFQDNGVSATNNGVAFTTVAGGDGGECVIDYSNPNFIYRETQSGTLRRSSTGVFGSGANIISALTDPAAFIAPYMLHRATPSTMFFPRTNVWRSTNVTATPSASVAWEAVSTFAPGATIRVVEQSPANLDILYISRGSGGASVVYRSDNANAVAASVAWSAITKPQGLPVTDIKAHPTDQNIVYATAGMMVFKSTDKGVTWTDISGNLPALFINCLVLDKNANEGIYIGNQTGVWYKDATISEWILFSSGLPPVDVRELEIYFDANPANSRISAATYGRGIWQSDLAEINVVNPSNFTATPTNTSQIDLSWVLNTSNNNVLIATSPTTTFGVPLDGTGYSTGNTLPGGGTVIYVGSLTNFSHTGLTAATSYCYKIWSVNGSNQYSAGLPSVCASTLSHDWTGNVDNDWFNVGNWGPGAVPTATDGAYIPAGRPNYPLINADGATCYHLTIEAGASVAMDAVTSYTLQVTGDWLNNGTFTQGVGTVEFNGTNELQKITGSSTTDFHILQVSKGSTGNTLDALSPITLNALVDAPLSLVSGTFRLSNAASNITAIRANGQGAANAIGFDKRFWVAAGTFNVNSSWRVNQGELKITGGTVNVGNAANQVFDYLNFGKIVLESGILNVSAGIWGNSGALNSTGILEISGGTMNLGVYFNGFARGMLEVNANCDFTMSDGAIVFRRGNGHTHQYYNLSSNQSVTGGAIQIGDASTPASQTIRINSTTPVYNLTVNATNSPIARLVTNNLTVLNDLTISGGTLDANNLNLNVGGHWTNDGTFTPSTGTVIFNGAANQNLAGSTATTFNNLTLNNAAGLTLSGSTNTTVNSALILTNGVITTGSNTLVIPSTGSVARTSGHIFGNLQKHIASGANISQTFEIGDAEAANYTPATVAFASVSTPGNLVARAVSGDHPTIGSATLNASKSVNRYWSFTNSGTTFTTCDAVFNFLTADLDPSTSTSSLICGKYDAPNWTYPTVGTRTATSTETTGLSSFSDLQLAEAPCVNPDVPTLDATVNPTCSGQSTTLSISSGNLNGAASWQWYSGSCGGTAVGSGISIMVSPGTTTTYYARGEGGCVGTPGSCGSITVMVNSLPTPAITAPMTVCSGGSALLDAGAGYTAYAWSNSGGTNQTATFTNITSNTTYTVTVMDGNGCEGTDTHAVNVNALPTPTITGPSDICSGGSALLDAGAGYSAYAWSNSGGTNQTATFANITSNTTYTVTVTDGNGCEGTDSHAVTVSVCGYSISGQIKWEHDGSSGVKDAIVALIGDQTGSTTTPVSGNYTLTTTTGSNFTVTPGKSINKLNGVTVADAQAIQQHIVNITPISSPYKQVGADVNKSNSISTVDATIINQALLGNPAAIAQFKTSWRFVPATHTMLIPPWGFPEKISYTGLSSNQTGQDYFGIKTGDVVSTWANPANFGAGEPLVLRANDRILQAGEILEVDFRADQLNDLTSFQFALHFDPEQLSLEGIEPLDGLHNVSFDNFGTFNLSEGEIRMVWAQAQGQCVEEATALFRLKFKVLDSGLKLSAVLHLENSILPAYAYNSVFAESGVLLKYTETSGTNQAGANAGVVLLQNQPNPFGKMTTIGFVLPVQTNAQLRIYDLNGRLIQAIENSYPAGYNEEKLHLESASGLLWYELITPFGVLTKRMVAAK